MQITAPPDSITQLWQNLCRTIEENKKKAVSLSFLSSQALAFPALDNSTDQQAYIQNCHKILLEFATAIHDAAKEMLDTMKLCEDVF